MRQMREVHAEQLETQRRASEASAQQRIKVHDRGHGCLICCVASAGLGLGAHAALPSCVGGGRAACSRTNSGRAGLLSLNRPPLPGLRAQAREAQVTKLLTEEHKRVVAQVGGGGSCQLGVCHGTLL